MALSSLTSAITIGASWTAQHNITGTTYSPTQNSSQISKKSSVGTSASNNAAGGGDELVSFIQSISNSSNTTIDLTNLTDILSTANTNLARIKGVIIQLLSTSDDSTNGTNCTSITVGAAASNAWTSQSANRGWLATNTSTFDIPNGGAVSFVTPTANGVLVDGTHKNLFIVNNDSSNAAAVQITLQGASS
jgi:hypothetical protein